MHSVFVMVAGTAEDVVQQQEQQQQVADTPGGAVTAGTPGVVVHADIAEGVVQQQQQQVADTLGGAVAAGTPGGVVHAVTADCVVQQQQGIQTGGYVQQDDTGANGQGVDGMLNGQAQAPGSSSGKEDNTRSGAGAF